MPSGLPNCVNGCALRREEEKSWAAANGELAEKLDQFLSGKLPAIDYLGIKCGENVATRAASAAVLGVLAEKVENMIVASADLSNSDKTDGFLKKTRAISKEDMGGRFLQPGVCEFTMACIMNGMALHGGIVPACGTFFVFSDYMKPALRLSAADAPAGEVHLDTRFVPRRRGRSDAPAGGTRGSVAPDGTIAQPSRANARWWCCVRPMPVRR